MKERREIEQLAQRLLIAAVVLASGATACSVVGQANRSPGATVAETPAGPAPSAAEASGRATATPSRGTPPTSSQAVPETGVTKLGLSVDPALLRLLPARLGSVRLQKHTLEPGAVAPQGFSDDLGRALLAATSAPERDLSVAWAEAGPANADRTLGLTIAAFRVRGADGVRLRQIVVGDRASVSGPPQRLETSWWDDRSYVVLRGSLIGASGETVFLITFAPGTDLTGPPPDDLDWTAEDLAAALPEADPVSVARPLNPLPSFRPPDSDQATMALLPKSVGGMPVKEFADTGFASVEEMVRGLPTYQLSLSAGFDPATATAAAGYTEDLPTFFVVVTRAPGLDRRTIIGALVDDFAGIGGRTIETVDVGGRRVQILDDIALYAEDELLYSMMYIDMGDPFGATKPPLPALRDLAVEIVGELP